MPVIPGLDPNLGIQGENNPVFQGGKLVNQSGIGLGLSKFYAMPPDVEEVDGYRERWRHDEQAVTRVFNVPWGVRKSWIDLILGYTSAIALPGQPVALRRTCPIQEPEFPWLYAVEIELVAGQGAYGQNPNVFAQDNLGNPVMVDGQRLRVPKIAFYDASSRSDKRSAKYAVHYRPLSYEVRTDQELAAIAGNKGELERFVTREIAFMIDSIGLPKSIQFDPVQPGFPDFGFANQAIHANAGQMLIRSGRLEYTWHNVPDPPLAAIDQCLGKVNADTFDGARGWRSYAPHTLLCQPPKVKRNPRTIVGRVSWDVTYVFLYKPDTWDKLPAADGEYYFVSNRNTGARPYKPADFDILFKPPTPVQYQ